MYRPAPKPQGLPPGPCLEPPTQICSADISCSVGGAGLTHPSIQLVINFFLSIYSTPDTGPGAGFIAGKQGAGSHLTELAGKQVIVMRCVGEVLQKHGAGKPPLPVGGSQGRLPGGMGG